MDLGYARRPPQALGVAARPPSATRGYLGPWGGRVAIPGHEKVVVRQPPGPWGGRTATPGSRGGLRANLPVRAVPHRRPKSTPTPLASLLVATAVVVAAVAG